MSTTVDYQNEARQMVKGARECATEAGTPDQRFAFAVLSHGGRARLALVFEDDALAKTGKVPIFDLPRHIDPMTLSYHCNEAAGVSPKDADAIMRSAGFGGGDKVSLLPGLPGGRALQ